MSSRDSLFFFFKSHAPHRDLHSFPTRRSSDLGTELVSTTVGRALLRDICPRQIPFETINKVMGKKQLAELIDLVYRDRKSTRLNSSHVRISYAVFCLKKKNKEKH